MKKLLFLFICLLFTIPAQAQYGGGTGEPNSPYLISEPNHMQAIGADSNDWDKHFLLVADIDLSSYTGDSFNIIGNSTTKFTGVFDGNDHAISNFTYSSTWKNYIGLFGYVYGSNAEVKDLGLIDPNVDVGTGYVVGSLVGYLYDGTISSCYAKGGSISGYYHVGGLVGRYGYGTITCCYSTASVSGSRSVGGLVGSEHKASIISNCYSAGSVSGSKYVGGLVGHNLYGTISNCYSAASVSGTGSSVGGLVGKGGGAFGSYWDIQASGQSSSAGGTGKTTAQMQTASTFIGWGCEPVWTLDEGVNYPKLWWENKPGETLTAQLSDFVAGSGTQSDPYLIYTAEELNMIGLFTCEWDKHFKLMAHIDLGSYTGTNFNIIGHRNSPFTGVFYGKWFEISNFTYSSAETSCIGVFGVVDGENAEIRDLGLIDPNIHIAQVPGGTSVVGSLVGKLTNGATLSGCYALGGTISGNDYVGGLLGNNDDGTISNCYSASSVWGEDIVGGLLGSNYGTIYYCYSTGRVSGTSFHIGGLVGRNDGTIFNCYSTGRVSGAGLVGGLVGTSGGGKATNSFWDIWTSAQSSSAGGTGLTTTEMQDPNTFLDVGWDFVGESENGLGDFWAEPSGGGYPIFWWQLSPLPELPTFSGGTGDVNDPYLISMASQLNRIGHNPRLVRANFKLINDIDLAGIRFFTIGSEVYPFSGVFDGNGFEISNFTYSSAETSCIGLFGFVGRESAEIKDLGLIDPNVDVRNGYCIGSLVGRLDDGSITGCYALGANISGGNFVGGLIGRNYSGIVSNCYSIASVSGDIHAGGLVGGNCWSATISNCYSSGQISARMEGVGGLVANNYRGEISNCYSTASVGGHLAGGLVGTNLYGMISNCYSNGSVSGFYRVGGLVASTGNGIVKDSFWDVNTSGLDTSDGGTGKTTVEMQTKSTFTDAGWDFDTPIWTIDDGNDYPRLWWENHIPIADAGPNQIACARLDGIAEVILDGNNSYDSDGDELTYLWTWTIDSNAYDANGVSPTIELPVGEHIIELIVNDGIDDSEPDELVVTVIELVELLEILGQDILDLELPHGIENSLLVKLDTALQKLKDNNENNDVAAINALHAFINTVQAQYGKKVAEEDADDLIATAQQIIDMLSDE